MKALAVSGTIEGIKNLISRFFYGSTITLAKISPDTWSVSTGRGLTAYIVKFSKGRYRFEEKPAENPSGEIDAGMKEEAEHDDLYKYIRAHGLPSREVFRYMIAARHIREDGAYYTKLRKAGL